MNTLHTIGEAAARTGLTPKMIRYYESQALFTPKGRSDAGYRLYDEADLHALRFIRSARELGFSLAQIADLTDLWRDRHRASAEVKRLAMAHIDELEAKAAVLQSMAATLRNLARHCHGDERPECPILEGLAAQAAIQAPSPAGRPAGRARKVAQTPATRKSQTAARPGCHSRTRVR